MFLEQGFKCHPCNYYLENNYDSLHSVFLLWLDSFISIRKKSNRILFGIKCICNAKRGMEAFYEMGNFYLLVR